VILRRSGLRTLSLTPAIEPARLGRALRALDPQAVILTGRRVSLDAIGRLVYAVRSVAREVAVFDYRGAVPDTGASTVCRLGEAPVAARDRLLSQLDAARAATPLPRVAAVAPARAASARA
jgi:MerR family transcriptional regulator, light-induced transcriptional regulator